MPIQNDLIYYDNQFYEVHTKLFENIILTFDTELVFDLAKQIIDFINQ